MGINSTKLALICTALPLVFAVRAPAAVLKPPLGPHTIVADHLLEAFPPVEPLPGGGYVAMGTKYMLVSHRSILRWRLLPIPRKPGTGFPLGVTWVGGGSHARFFLQYQPTGTKHWLGRGKGTGLVEMLPGPKFRFVRPMVNQKGNFLNSRIGVFPFGNNLILTFDGGRHLHPQPPMPKLFIEAARWVPGGGGRMVVCCSTHVQMEQLTRGHHMKVIWRKPVTPFRLYNPKINDLVQGRDAEGSAFFLQARKRQIWLASNKNVYVLAAATGDLEATIPGKQLTALRPLHTLAFRRHVPGWGTPVKPNQMPPWAWPGQLTATIIGKHLLVQKLQSRAPQLVVWTIRHKALALDFKIPIPEYGRVTYVNTPQGVFWFRFKAATERISFRQKKLVPITLRVRVPGHGPWDPLPPGPPVPRALMKRFNALCQQLPEALLMKVAHRVARKKGLSMRQRIEMMMRLDEAALKKIKAKQALPKK